MTQDGAAIVHEDEATAASVLRDIGQALEVAGREGGGDPLPLVPNFAEIIAKLRGSLTISEIAEIAGVKERQVHHWAAGKHNPQGETRRRLLDLHQVISHLETQLSSEQIKVWLWSPHPDLPEPPAECMKGGDFALVLAASERLALRDEADDVALIELARNGNVSAYEAIIRRYRGFVRLKTASYLLLTHDAEDLMQEGLLGLYKAIRDFPIDRERSFRHYAELCITRQILMAVKSAARQKQSSLDRYGSLNQPPASEDMASRSDEALDGVRGATQPLTDHFSGRDQLSDRGAFDTLLSGLSGTLSDLESRVLSLYLEGNSFEAIASQLDCDIKTVDNALQRVKRKIAARLTAKNDVGR